MPGDQTSDDQTIDQTSAGTGTGATDAASPSTDDDTRAAYRDRERRPVDLSAGALADDVVYVEALGLLADVTDRLMDTAKELGDDDVRAPSLLPGWSRGHVLTHVARNADGLVNVLRGASTGVPTPAYPSREARDSAIEEGSGRSASELESDVESSGERLLAAVADLPPDRRHVTVRTGSSGIEAPAHDVLWWRIREVAYHHVDLGTGYGFADMPPEVLRRGLAEAVERLAAQDAPPLRLQASDLGWSAGSAGTQVSGPAGALLGWLTGRSDGSTLDSDGPLPRLPAWG